MGNNTENLQKLRDDILGDLTNMSDILVGDESIGFDVLLTISRNTGNNDLLTKAFEKCKKMPESLEKADALLQILGEVEERLAEETEPLDETADQSNDSPQENAASPVDVRQEQNA